MTSALDLSRDLFPAAAPSPGTRGSLFIVGAPRTGTTSLAKALAAHPQICFSKPKETHFFLGRHSGAGPDEVRERFERAYFPTLRPEQRVIAEGSVSYLYDRGAIERILRFDPHARFVVGLRNPLDLLPSYHSRLLYTMDEDVADFARAWALQDGRRRARHCLRAAESRACFSMAKWGGSDVICGD